MRTEKVIWNQAPEPDEGKPASQQELVELLAQGTYVPGDDEKARKYYEQKIDMIQREKTGMSTEQKDELIEYYSQKKIDLILGDEKVYKQEFNNLYKTETGASFVRGITKELAKMVGNKQLEVLERSKLIVPSESSFAGLSYEMNVGKPSVDHDNMQYAYDVDITNLGGSSIYKFIGKLVIDKKTGDIKIVIMPNPREAQRVSPREMDNLKAKAGIAALGGMANLFNNINYDDHIYQGGQLDGKEVKGERRPTTLEDKKQSVLPYRRRTINPEGIKDLQTGLDTTLATLQEYVENVDDEIKNKLRAENGRLELDIIDRASNNMHSIGEVREANGLWSAQNMSLLTAVVNDSLVIRKHAITLVLTGLYLSRDARGLGPAWTQRPSFRRLEGRTILVVGGSYPPERRKKILKLWKKRSDGNLTDNEKTELENFLRENKLDGDLTVDLEIREGIHYKDGKFVDGSKINNPSKEHTQTYLKKKRANF
jgi:hypothetical protein